MTRPQRSAPTWEGMHLRILARLALALPLAGCAVSGAVENSEATSSALATDDARHLRANVTGLLGGGLVLEDATAGTVSAGSDGVVVFPNAIETGASYALAISLQPIGPHQECAVRAGSGVVGEIDPVVEITCAAPTFTVGGHVTGVGAVGLVLTGTLADASAESVALSSDGTFRFETEIGTGASYTVTIAQHPAGQECWLYFASGKVTTADVDNVEVLCGEVEPEPVAEVAVLADGSPAE